MKICISCKESKDESHYYKGRRLCIKCKNMQTDVAQAKRYGTPEWLAYNKQRYQKNREKYLARSKVRVAVATGKLDKPKQCSDCYSKVPLQGHHEDYGKPLEVIWLCDYCHKKLHRKIKIFREAQSD